MKSRLLVAVVSSVVTMLVVGGVAWAIQNPVDNAGVIHACYNPSTGVVKLQVQPTCPTKGPTTPISWNAQGPQGNPGTPAFGEFRSAFTLGFTNGDCPPGKLLLRTVRTWGDDSVEFAGNSAPVDCDEICPTCTGVNASAEVLLDLSQDSYVERTEAFYIGPPNGTTFQCSISMGGSVSAICTISNYEDRDDDLDVDGDDLYLAALAAESTPFVVLDTP